MYHSVARVPVPALRSLGVPPARLREQLGALRDAGYRLVGLSSALDLGEPDVVALTFDDGYADFFDAALPVLAELDATATLYPAVGHLGGPAAWLGPHASAFGPLLSWTQLREVAASGIEIGSHGLLHQPLDVLPPTQLRREVADSRDRLMDELGQPVRSFCYPHGYHGRAVRAAVAQAGYDNACEIGYRLSTVDGDRLAVPRLMATPDLSGAEIVRLVQTGGPPLVPLIKQAAQPAWRVTRRLALRLLDRKLT
jgi:peptidoglycan/xylan/chitin deacetylase (PgdA/CDA1 family)